MARFTVIIAIFALSGCSGLVQSSCRPGLTLLTKAELFFGRSIATSGEVSETDWQRFAAEEITPRFPDGLTVEDAEGQWSGQKGLVRERSKHVVIVYSGNAAAKLEAIRVAYKSRFHQDSVLLVETGACTSF